jgi:hypothetical protein
LHPAPEIGVVMLFYLLVQEVRPILAARSESTLGTGQLEDRFCSVQGTVLARQLTVVC